jgi:hypothetical protein
MTHDDPKAVQTAADSIRVTYASNYDSVAAVDSCCAALEGITPLFLLVFCGGKHDPVTVLGALRGRYGGIPIVGGSAAGVIGSGRFGYSGLEIGILAIASAALCPKLYLTHDLLAGETLAGEALGRDVARAAEDGAVVLLLFDSVASLSPRRLHYASAIVEGFNAGLGDTSISLIGGGLLTDINIQDGWIFDGAGVCKHAAAALVFPPEITAETVILHGCRPVSSFMEITRIEGAVVFELDGEPALGVLERMLGLRIGSAEGGDLSLIATLGEKYGDPFADYDENAYVNRLILLADRASGSITLFEPDFRLGTKVQIMARDNALMLESVRQGTESLRNKTRGKQTLFGLYIDCAGRASGRSGAAQEEAGLMMENFDPALPLLGFYSGVEIAPIQGYSRPLDWTGVLTVVSLGS